MNESSSVKPKRARVPSSCYVCRVRKKKCDKRKPYCTYCIENEITDSCSYGKKIWNGKTISREDRELFKEVNYLRNRVAELEYALLKRKSLEVSTDSSANVYENKDEVRIKSSIDPESNIVMIKGRRPKYYGVTSYMSLAMNDEYAKEINRISVSGEPKSQDIDVPEMSDCSNGLAENVPPMLLMKSIFSKELSSLSGELPSYELCLSLIDRFFQYCYQRAPIIEKETLLCDLNSVIELKNNKITGFRLKDSQLLSIIAQFIIILRFAYITLPIREFKSGVLSVKDMDTIETFLSKDFSITNSIIEYAQLFLLAPCSRSVDLRYIQALFLLYSYKTSCPECDPDLFETSSILLACIHAARECGLSNDPSKLSNFKCEQSEQYIWRKIWAYLLYFDAKSAFTTGKVLLVSDKELDSMWPFNILCDNFNDFPASEIMIRRDFLRLAEATLITRKCMNLLCDRTNKVYISSILIILEELKVILYSKSRCFEQLYNSKVAFAEVPPGERVQEFLMRLTLTYQFYTLNFMLFDNLASEDNEKRKIHMCQSLECGMIILKIALNFSSNPSSMFGSEFETFVAPLIFSHALKVLPTFMSLMAKSLDGKFSFRESIGSFTSPDSIGIVEWARIGDGGEVACVKNFCALIEQLILNTTKLGIKFFSCHRLRCASICINKILYRKLSQVSSQSNNSIETLSESDISDESYLLPNQLEKNVEEADLFWKSFTDNLYAEGPTLNFEPLDPFLNDIQPNFESIFDTEL